MKTKIITLFVASFFIISCDKKELPTENETKTTIKSPIINVLPENEEEPKTNTSSEDNTQIALTINSNDKMQYNKKELRVKSGQKVTLTLNHTGKMNKSIMGHNWVLLKQSTDIPAFAKLAMRAKDNGYIPKSSDIIAHTETIGGGESSTITFNAPAKGTYNFICSFPGHYGVMKGKFIVE